MLLMGVINWSWLGGGSGKSRTDYEILNVHDRCASFVHVLLVSPKIQTTILTSQQCGESELHSNKAASPLKYETPQLKPHPTVAGH